MVRTEIRRFVINYYTLNEILCFTKKKQFWLETDSDIILNKRVRPLRGRPIWGRPCSWVRTDGGNGRCHGNEGTRGKAARDPYATCQISQQAAKLWGFFANNAISRRDLDLWPIDLVIGPGVLVSQGPFLPSFVYVGLFVFPLGGGTLAFGYGRPTPATAGILEIGPRGCWCPRDPICFFRQFSGKSYHLAKYMRYRR